METNTPMKQLFRKSFKDMFELAVSMEKSNNIVKKKGQTKYIPWATALKNVKTHISEDVSYEVLFNEVDNTPLFKSGKGYYVQVTLSIDNIKHTQMLPVINYANKIIEAPNAMDVNYAIRRALTKAIAELTGFGLHMWSDDYDDVEVVAAPVKIAPVKTTTVKKEPTQVEILTQEVKELFEANKEIKKLTTAEFNKRFKEAPHRTVGDLKKLIAIAKELIKDKEKEVK